MPEQKTKGLLAIALWMAFVFIFAYSWVPGGLDFDSLNYAVAAKEIVRTNRWLAFFDPVYEGPFYYHFPLCIWVTAIFFKWLGVSSFTAKLFSMITAVSAAATIFFFGKLLKNVWVGFFAVISFLITNHIIRLSQECRMDLPVTFFITLALFFFILAQRRNRLYYLLFGLATCLAIFAKDIFGAFPLAIVFLYLVITFKFKELIHPLFILGVLLAVLPVIGWIRLEKLLYNQTIFYGWWYWNFLHLLKAKVFVTVKYYYLWAIVTKYFYLLPFAIYGGYLVVKEALRERNKEGLISIIWVLIFPTAFTFGRQRLHYFILPIYAATAILCGIAFDRILKESIKLRVVKWTKYILVFGTAVLVCFPINYSARRNREMIKIAPFVDEVLKQAPEFDFFAYRQGKDAMLFYLQQISRVKSFGEKELLEEKMLGDSKIPRFCLIWENDFKELGSSLQHAWQTVLEYNNLILISDQKNPAFTVKIP